MHEDTLTKLFATTAVLAAVGALLAGPAGAVLLVADADTSGDGAAVAASVVEPGTIPYLSHGVGVGESEFSGRPPLGLTGDSALTRVSAPEPEGLTGDSALTRSELGGVSGGRSGSAGERDWTWMSWGLGLAALFAATAGGLYLSVRQRGRVALP